MAEKQNTPEIRFEGFTDPWEQRKLGSIAASFDYGLNAAATEYDGQNKYLRITDIDDTTHEFLKSDLTTPLADLAMSADYLLEEGDLLFARTGASVGKTYLYRQYDGTVYFAGFLIRARIGESADPEFVYQATLTDAYKKYVAITSQRSGQPGVNAQEYADYQLMLPSRTEQQQIGMTLRSLDNLIALHQRKCDKLCTVKKSMLDKMFPKPGETEPEIRFEGFTDPWEQRKFSELYVINNERNESCEFGYDKTLSVATMTYNGGNGAADNSLSTYKVVRVGDIAFEGHTNKEHAYGRFVLNDAGDGLMSPRFSCLRPIVEQRYNFWKHYIPRESMMRPVLVNATKSGTMMNELVPADLMRESILVPVLYEQEAIGRFFKQLDDLITLHQRKLELLRNIKKSLLNRMFVYYFS